MSRVWIATVLQFFLPGLGWLVLGEKRLLGLGWLVGVLGLTYVETGIQTAAPAYYLPMFASVFLMNTMFAADVWRAGRAAVGGPATR